MADEPADAAPEPPADPPPTMEVMRAPVVVQSNAHLVRLGVALACLIGGGAWWLSREDPPPAPPPQPSPTTAARPPVPTPTKRPKKPALPALTRAEAWPFEEADDSPAGRVLQHLKAGAYDKADAVLAAERARGRRAGDFEDHLTLAVHQLLARPEAFKRHEAWIKARPRSVYARLARGRFRIAAAWASRGGGWASTVTKTGWRGFEDHLQDARKDLEAAHALDPTLPHASGMLVTVAMGLGLDPAPYLARARKADPHFVSAYSRRVTSLLPRWGGSIDAVRRFTQAIVKANPKEPALRLLWVRAKLQIGVLQGNLQHPDPEVERELAAVEAAYPKSGRVARNYGHYFRAADVAKYAAWTRKSAERGHPTGARYWALALQLGRGVERDIVEAFRWFAQAARWGEVPAYSDCGLLLSQLSASLERAQGLKTKADLKAAQEYRYKAARAWYERGIACGNTYAIVGLAELLARGDGRLDEYMKPQPQPYESAKLLREAIRRGNPNARATFLRLLSRYPVVRKPGDPKH